MLKYNIFTDAASFNNGYKNPKLPQCACSAAILYDKNMNKVGALSRFLPDATNNVGEVTAISEGIMFALKYIHKRHSRQKLEDEDIVLNLYSDSEICVKSLTQWVQGWKEKSVDGIWYSSKGSEVANQNILKDIDRLLNARILFKGRLGYSSNVTINIYHIRGHISPSSSKDVNKFIGKFKINNDIDISLEEALIYIKCNDEVDRLAGDKQKEFMKEYYNNGEL